MKGTIPTFVMVVVLLTLVMPAPQARAENPSTIAQEDNSDLPQDLSNPLADLMTIPSQVNYDQSISPRDRGEKLQINIQPVIPFHLNNGWNLISRTIMPIIYQDDVVPGKGFQSGLCDLNVSLFFSPRAPTHSGLIWGAGPVLLLPTTSDSLLGTEKWDIGPTAVALAGRGPWTIGLLGNHIW